MSCEARPQTAGAVMGKKKGRGRGRPKGTQDERPREPGGVQRETNINTNVPSRTNNVRSEQFQDADCGYQQLTGKNDLQKHSQFNSNDHQSPERTLYNCSAVNCGINNLESTGNERKIRDVDVSSKNTMGVKSITYSVGSFNQKFPNIPGVNDQNSCSASIAFVGEPSSTKKVNIVRRPNFGIEGKRIAVVSNYFLLKGNGNDIYHYHVEITDKSASAKQNKAMTIKEEKAHGATQLQIQQERNVGKQKCREVINQLIKDKLLSNFQPFYDGYKNLYTFKPLPVGEGKTANVCVTSDNRTKSYVVTVKPVKKNCGGNVISLESLNEVCSGRSDKVPLEAVIAFDMILCHREPPFHEVGVGKSFFSFSEMRKNPMGGEIELWKGYNSSLQLTQKGPAILVNSANKAFHCSGFVIEQCCNVLGFDITERNLSKEDIRKLKKNLRGVKVEVTHLPYPRKYTVESVTQENANNLVVNIGNSKMSVAQFFTRKYKTLKFPNLPCLSMKTTGKPTYTPMEVCVILPGQPKLGKLSPIQTSKMISKTAISPGERFESIMNYVKTISQINGPYITQAGYDIQMTPVSLTARVISPPALAYSNGPAQPDSRGVWRTDGKNFSESSSNARWILISFSPSDTCPLNTLKRLSSGLVETSKNLGLHLRNPVAIRLLDWKTSTFDALLDAKRCDVQFAFVVLSRLDKNHSYDELKFIADVKLGLITQCMEDAVVLRCCEGAGASQILNNLLSKLNTKLGGINHTFSKQPTVAMKRAIVMGADAAHSPRGSKCPSIAAVVGSIDDVPFQYAVSCKVQMNPDASKISQEIILHMKEMTKHVLNSYKKRNSYFPEKIIFFRDGVSQGQFETVLKNELDLIQTACEELLNRKLPITFIIVQKRHQTRFVPSNPKDGVGKCGNVPPGMTVDTDVTHPVYFDYFQCSHEGIKGTSRPAHYVVLHDDNNFKADELQKFSHDLCHVYGRCNRSISIPAPAMNAHLAAARAKKYIDWHLSDDASSSGYGSDEPLLSQEVINFVNNISDIKSPMFFL